MLKGKILEINYLKTWGMINELSEINSIDDKYCNELIYKIDGMFSGRKSGSYTWFMQIPSKYVKNDLLRLNEILLKYIKNENLSSSDILELECIANKEINPQTLNEVLAFQISSLLNMGYDFYADGMKFELKHTVFVNEGELAEQDFLDKIITLLDCYNGKRGFSVFVVFNNGIGNVSISI